uniref:NB-ARC domain-containing protein n=1 Tax=Arundo donax TaxID=35708 RepID=A0A0A9AG13_ARUDO
MGGLGKTTLIKYVCQSQKLNCVFEKWACVMVMRPFIIEEFLKSLVTQLAECCVKEGMIDFLYSARKAISMTGV